MDTMILFLYLMIIPDLDKKLERYDHVKCMAQNAYYETSNDDFLGRVAMSQVVMNRVKVTNFSLFPNKVCDVIKKEDQFSWYNDGKSDAMGHNETRKEAYIAAAVALMEVVPHMVGESVYYYSLELPKPWWEPHMKHYGPIGRHQFMLEMKKLIFKESYHLLNIKLELINNVKVWGEDALADMVKEGCNTCDVYMGDNEALITEPAAAKEEK